MKYSKRGMVPLGIILLISIWIRVWGAGSNLPYIYHPDEPIYIDIIQKIFKTGDLNPHFFNYPSLFFYINSFTYIPYFLIGKALGIFATRADILSPISITMAVALAPFPSSVLLGRSVTIFFGVLTVGLTYLVGKKITSHGSIGLLAALLVGLFPANVLHSRYITPDTYVTFFALLAFLLSVLVYRQGQTWQYILAGICVGLTASTKYNGSLIVVPFIVAHFLRSGKSGFFQPRFYLGLLSCIVGFILTTPYALFDWAAFLGAVKFEFQHYSTGHAGMEGNSLSWYLTYMLQTAPIVFILAVIEILRGIVARSKEIILLFTFPVIYFIFISSYTVRNERTLLPLTPFVFLLAVSLLYFLFQKARQLQPGRWRNLPVGVVASLTLVALATSIYRTVADSLYLTSTDSRDIAAVWIRDNLPAGSRIALESYSPYIDPAYFSVQGFERIIDQPPDWYISQGFDYLIFAQRMYGRYYRGPAAYALEISEYDAFFQEFHLLKVFEDSQYQIRLYTVK